MRERASERESERASEREREVVRGSEKEEGEREREPVPLPVDASVFVMITFRIKIVCLRSLRMCRIFFRNRMMGGLGTCFQSSLKVGGTADVRDPGGATTHRTLVIKGNHISG